MTKSLIAETIGFSDPALFSIFTIPLVSGNPGDRIYPIRLLWSYPGNGLEIFRDGGTPWKICNHKQRAGPQGVSGHAGHSGKQRHPLPYLRFFSTA